MATEKEHDQFIDQMAILFRNAIKNLGSQISDPQVTEALVRDITEKLLQHEEEEAKEPPPPDYGFSQLIGLGPEATTEFGKTRTPPGIEAYDETVTSERLLAVGDLYYIYQHEKIGVFKVMQKLQQLFRSGTVRLSSGVGAYGLYQFDKRQVLRYTRLDRFQAYRRVLGYSNVQPPPGAKPNSKFHGLFSHFIAQVARFFRDKRVSEVIRPRPTDPSFGSVAIVRRAGLDLRNNLKQESYGHVNVLRVELLQLLDEAFRILRADDIKKLYGAESAWDVIEEVLQRYFNETINASQRNRMAVAGREIIRWLAQPNILNVHRAEFEVLLLQVAEYAEGWYTSARSLGITAATAVPGSVVRFPGGQRKAV